MAATSRARTARAELTDALAASRAAREEAERELRLGVVVRSRAADALERTAGRTGFDETERTHLRGEYAAADRVVAERRADVERAREFERAATVVAGAFEAEATTASPLAAALIDLVGSRGASRGRTTLTAVRRPAPAARIRATRPRTA